MPDYDPMSGKLTYRDDVSWLIKTQDPMCVFDEVKITVRSFMPGMDLSDVEKVFNDTVSLFKGFYPGYKACTTDYHDLKHTTDVLLALASLFHGKSLSGQMLEPRAIRLALIAALMHDTGYIQAYDETHGTGAKYTAIHVERSIEFMEAYFKRLGWPMDDYKSAARMVLATNLSYKLTDIPFMSEEEKMGARALFISDMLGQMADRVYLEKLLFLYLELSEANVMGYSSEEDLLHKTVDFYETTWSRLVNEAGYTEDHMRRHFEVRWGIPHDLYAHAAQKNIAYLQYILENHRSSHREMLNRGGLVHALMQKTEALAT
ncbi:MAG: HD domain-containing protein [Thermodesulfovibrionales bacterium]|nr:HD domain-containing protein [Thermodesulfovibrionales bacterium]